MPGGDRTGPTGLGPGTGWGRGGCRKRGVAIVDDDILGPYGGRGRGFFARQAYAPAPLTPEERKSALKARLDLLEETAARLRKALGSDAQEE